METPIWVEECHSMTNIIQLNISGQCIVNHRVDWEWWTDQFLTIIWKVPKMGDPNSWMFDNGKYHSEMDDDWGYPLFQETSI